MPFPRTIWSPGEWHRDPSKERGDILAYQGTSFKRAFFLGGFLLLLYTSYLAYQIATNPVIVVNGDRAGSYLAIQFNFWSTLLDFIKSGALFYAATGVVCLGLWSQRTKRAYWCLHLAVWLIGITLWMQQGHPLPISVWPWLILSFLASLILLACYHPIIGWLASLGFRYGRDQKLE